MSQIAEKDCGRIQLSRVEVEGVSEFFLSGSNTTPGKPVWKLKDNPDIYIFNSGTKHGLVGGDGESLKSGKGFEVKSKNYIPYFRE